MNRDSLHARVAPETSEKLKEKALILGFVYDGEGSIGKLLDAIASEEIVLVPKPSWEAVLKKNKISG